MTYHTDTPNDNFDLKCYIQPNKEITIPILATRRGTYPGWMTFYRLPWWPKKPWVVPLWDPLSGVRVRSCRSYRGNRVYTCTGCCHSRVDTADRIAHKLPGITYQAVYSTFIYRELCYCRVGKCLVWASEILYKFAFDHWMQAEYLIKVISIIFFTEIVPIYILTILSTFRIFGGAFSW